MSDLNKAAVIGRIARNVAGLFDEVANATLLNLGVGIPTQVSDHITNPNVYIQAENGILGVGPLAKGEEIDPRLINAGRQPVTATLGCCYFDSSTAFGMIRGGYVDATVLGAFEVSQAGDVANWTIPNGKQLGVGGAMDLVTGANRVIIAMTHTNKGVPKLVQSCSLPVTGFGVVDIVVTELGIFSFEAGKVILKKIASDTTVGKIEAVTELDFDLAEELEVMLS